MSQFRKSFHAIHHCKYHIVWWPKYRYRILTGDIAEHVTKDIYTICGCRNVIVLELSVMPDYIHVIIDIPSKHSASYIMGMLEGKLSTRIFKAHCKLKTKPYWENHF